MGEGRARRGACDPNGARCTKLPTNRGAARRNGPHRPLRAPLPGAPKTQVSPWSPAHVVSRGRSCRSSSRDEANRARDGRSHGREATNLRPGPPAERRMRATGRRDERKRAAGRWSPSSVRAERRAGRRRRTPGSREEGPGWPEREGGGAEERCGSRKPGAGRRYRPSSLPKDCSHVAQNCSPVAHDCPLAAHNCSPVARDCVRGDDDRGLEGEDAGFLGSPTEPRRTPVPSSRQGPALWPLSEGTRSSRARTHASSRPDCRLALRFHP
jgi:hypothetical protein